MKKILPAAAVTAFFIIIFGFSSAGAFELTLEDDATIYLAQQTEETTKDEQAAEDAELDEYDDEYGDEDVQLIADPLSGLNYGFYVFNDKLYFWFLKPVARAYGFVIPEEIRSSIKNMFYNIRFPVRFINCLLQGKGQKAGDELLSFFLNTTAGLGGMANVAASIPNLDPSPEDFGQTFAVWGIGSGAYLMLPFLGPSSIRDGVGLIGNTLTDPIFWLTYKEDFWVPIAIRTGETVNATSLRIGDYEALKEAAIDPYVAIRNAWVQNRNKLIAE